MKPSARYLVPLLVILFLLIIPVALLEDSAAIVYRTLYVATAFSFFELYHLLIVAAVCSAVIAYSLARGYIGSCRALYSLYGVIILIASFSYGVGRSPVYGMLITALAIAGMDGLFFFSVRDKLSRISFLSITIPMVAVALFLPHYCISLSGFMIFALSFFVRTATRELSIPEVNMRSVTPIHSKGGVPAPSPPISSPARNPPNPQGPAQSGKLSRSRKAAVKAGTGSEAKQSISPASRSSNSVPLSPATASQLPANVAWPAQSDYARAMQNPGFSISPNYAILRNSKVLPNPYIRLPGSVVYSSGNYGVIFRLENNGLSYAMKCFTRSKQDLNARYSEISRALSPLSGKGLPFVNFQYLPGAIRTLKNPAIYFPVLHMDWVEGRNLNAFVSEQLRNRDRIATLASNFIDEMVRMRSAGIAHGDIAGDNIVIDSSGRITLVDYDGMFVPAFSGSKSPELGHDNFQHPRRTADHYSERLDNFSILVTYLSLLGIAEDPKLWMRYNKGDQDCLIFRKSDFLDPSRSGVIGELMKMKGRVRQLTELLVESLKHEPLWDGCDPHRLAKI
ncbi:MAG: hypothetical protein KIY12_02330 [Thermoplasmata archaeon]|uniref:Protein kinase domain-containing protein n=1 Tax=Candidatus Sysuiplasma superficiale TaxID=2823368 RepID=A0A8J8CCD1_9ARCH|nr:hypothetical protein [Candidatus Sysuiplasma superficiale]